MRLSLYRFYLQINLIALLVCLFIPLTLLTSPAYADDGIFPPSPVASKFINFDSRGFLINSKRTLIVSGTLHYSRVPRALWRDRLLRIKRGGFNTVDTSAFWNFHEPQEGKFDFSGDKDLDAFLKLVKSLGMYAVVRPGPYIRAEWDSGGYPVWLRFKLGVKVREENAEFEAAVARWFEKVMPIIAANQIHRGGAVIMVQLESEHPKGSGRQMPNGYFRRLREKALALGLEVPHFFSGLHQGNDPAGDKPWDSKDRSNPWYSTELRAGGHNLYGKLDYSSLNRIERNTWKILAYGGNGYNYHMLHGGTNFETWNNDEVASSYDYGAAIGQAGDLRPVYYRAKRAAWFARTFQSILADSENATDEYRDAATDPDIQVTARKSPAGTILFLDNNGYYTLETQVKLGNSVYPANDTLSVASGEIMPVVTNYKLTPEVTLEVATTRILGVSTQGDATTLVVYGHANSTGEIHFSVPVNRIVTTHGAQILSPDTETQRRLLVFNLRYPSTKQMEYSFTVGTQAIRILSISDELADRTWFLEAKGKNYILCGPDYVGDVVRHQGRLRFVTERQLPRAVIAESEAMKSLLNLAAEPDTAGSFVYSPVDGLQSLVQASGPLDKDSIPLSFLGPSLQNTWQIHRGDAEAQPQFDDANWKAGELPLPMGADGDSRAYAWYRTTVSVPKTGNYPLHFRDVGDWVSVFVNGKHQANGKVQRRFDKPVSSTLRVNLNEGHNTLAVLVAHYGRSKLFNYVGSIDKIDAKGLIGPVLLGPYLSAETQSIKWKWKADNRGEAAASEMADPYLNTNGNDWKEAKPPGEDVFNQRKGFVWYRADLGVLAGPNRVLHFESIDDNATIYLNGKRLLKHEGWNQPFDVPLDEAWKEEGPNLVAILVENGAGPGGIRGAVELRGDIPADGELIRGWSMRGGPGALDAPALPGFWLPFNAVKPPEGYGVASPAPQAPAFYRTEFDLPSAPPSDASEKLHLVFRVSLQGMSRGFVWLNGHNLGRYPEKAPVIGLYLPECWLKAGRNTLIIYDEEGNPPAQVHIRVEEAASCTLLTLEAKG